LGINHNLISLHFLWIISNRIFRKMVENGWGIMMQVEIWERQMK